jgi:hypothetical protein
MKLIATFLAFEIDRSAPLCVGTAALEIKIK